VSLRYRQMRPEDVPQCVSLIAAHPFIGLRYGEAIADLSTAWLRLLDYEAKSTVVFEEVQDRRVRIWGVGVSVFVNDDFMREVKTPPLFWVGPELARRIARGNSPVLTGRALRDANARGGLNLLTWEGCIRLEDAKRAEIYNKVILAFIEEHRGFLWKEIVGAQAQSAEMLRSMLMFSTVNGCWVDPSERDLQEAAGTPHLIGLNREMALSRPGSWVGGLFDYEPPCCSFSRSEQRLLFSALGGETDEQLSRALGISRSAIKKAWHSIYDRVARYLPELFRGESRLDTMSERGKEKKHRLLSYLREHREELRPISRKLLQQGAAQSVRRRSEVTV
jgi:hypothetical protein